MLRVFLSSRGGDISVIYRSVEMVPACIRPRKKLFAVDICGKLRRF